MSAIPFTSNYTDLSSERGYQFKFFCQKCGNGYTSTFEANKLGAAWVLTSGDAEVESETVKVKHLASGQEETLSLAEALARLSQEAALP